MYLVSVKNFIFSQIIEISYFSVTAPILIIFVQWLCLFLLSSECNFDNQFLYNML